MSLMKKMARLIQQDVKMKRKASVDYKKAIKEALEEATGTIENTEKKETYEFGDNSDHSYDVEGIEYTIEFDVSVDLKNYIEEPVEVIVDNVKKAINENKREIDLLKDFLSANMDFGPTEHHEYNDWVDAEISIDENGILKAKGYAWDFESDAKKEFDREENERFRRM